MSILEIIYPVQWSAQSETGNDMTHIT